MNLATVGNLPRSHSFESGHGSCVDDHAAAAGGGGGLMAAAADVSGGDKPRSRSLDKRGSRPKSLDSEASAYHDDKDRGERFIFGFYESNSQ